MHGTALQHAPVIYSSSVQPIKQISLALDLLLLVLLHHFIKEVRVDLHEQLEGIIHHPMNGTAKRSAKHAAGLHHPPVPMGFRVGVQGREHDGQDDREVVAHQINHILVVPI